MNRDPQPPVPAAAQEPIAPPPVPPVPPPVPPVQVLGGRLCLKSPSTAASQTDRQSRYEHQADKKTVGQKGSIVNTA